MSSSSAAPETTVSDLPHRCRNDRRLGPAKLLVAIVAIGIVWGWLLPALAERESISKRLEFLQQQKIDPSAMYYTELEVMEEILRKIERPGDGN